MLTDRERLKRISDIIESVDNRAMAFDGPVPSTTSVMTDEEVCRIYALSMIQDETWRAEE